MPGGQPLRGARVGGRVLLAATCGVALAACARPLELTPATPEAAVTTICSHFTDALPDELPTVGGRRDTTPTSVLTAAYGDPPVGVRCGVPIPEALLPTSTLVTVDTIDWFPEELAAGWRLTTVGLAAGIELTVPAEQGPAPSVAADLAPTVLATIRAAD